MHCNFCGINYIIIQKCIQVFRVPTYIINNKIYFSYIVIKTTINNNN